MANPSVIVLAGPNGAGKTTTATAVVQETLDLAEFVNADIIAQGLSGFSPEGAALQAGRIMLERIRELADARASFSFETTLASRTFAPWLAELTAEGYSFHLLFFWLPSADMAIARVAQRVRMGGHFVDDETVRRRYQLGIQNFFRLYRQIATSWTFYDNSQNGSQRLVARGRGTMDWDVNRPALWERLKQSYDSPPPSER